MGDISMLTWIKAIFVLLVCAGMGGAIGWGFGADHAAKFYKKLMADKDEHFRKYLSVPYVSWYWWVGRDRIDRKEYIVGVVAQDEKEAKMKLNPARLKLLENARASGRKDLGYHVLVAHSREEINVQGV